MFITLTQDLGLSLVKPPKVRINPKFIATMTQREALGDVTEATIIILSCGIDYCFKERIEVVEKLIKEWRLHNKIRPM